MKKIIGYLIVSIAVVFSGVWVAAQVNLNTFRPDSLIESATVNENFQGLAKALSAKQNLIEESCAAGSAIRVVNEDGTVECQATSGSAAAGAWLLTGNAGTTAGENFLGTTDDEPFEIHVNGQRVVRLEPQERANAFQPNVILGASSNKVTDGTFGATISGGVQNIASGTLRSTVAGGFGNTASGTGATVGGGKRNLASELDSTVAGGSSNIAGGSLATVGGGGNNEAGNEGATVGGGIGNEALGNRSTVAGGQNNVATGVAATVPGGSFNLAQGDFSFAAGILAKALHNQTFVWNSDDLEEFASTGENQFLINAGGGVGIGTNEPAAFTQLHVVDNPNFSVVDLRGHVVAIENASTGGSGDVLGLKMNVDNPGGGANFISFIAANNEFVGSIEGDGSGGVTFKSGSGDFAEYLPKLELSESLSPGTVVGVFAGKISKRTQGADRVMVVSTAPLMLGNQPKAGQEERFSPVAFMGQVPVKVVGTVVAGDYLVASGKGDGTAVAASAEIMTFNQLSMVVGRALETSSNPGLKQVKALVGLPNTELVSSLMARKDAQISELQARVSELETLEARLVALEQVLVSRQVATSK